MTAWQVFASTHWLARRVLRQHGCFSVNREGHDLQAYRQTVNLLQQSHPLVVFPEGEVFHLNDRVMHFRRGAATAALRAANRSGRPVACIPCGIKYQYEGDPRPLLVETMNRLEPRVGLSPRMEMPLVHRIRRLASAVLKVKEREYFGSPQGGSTQERTTDLMNSLLSRLESRYRITSPCRAIPERVKELRRLTIARQETSKCCEEQQQLQQDLDDLFFVMQLFSYPVDYLDRTASLGRLVETIDKLEEDILQVPRASLRTNRRAIVRFGDPILADVGSAAMTADDLTESLQRRVQSLLDEMPQSTASPPQL
jgi:1-acyl-sn-glycerol-3-phosphate acyltransferase